MDFEAMRPFLSIGDAVTISTRRGDNFEGTLCVFTPTSFALVLADGSRSFVAMDQIEMVRTRSDSNAGDHERGSVPNRQPVDAHDRSRDDDHADATPRRTNGEDSVPPTSSHQTLEPQISAQHESQDLKTPPPMGVGVPLDPSILEPIVSAAEPPSEDPATPSSQTVSPTPRSSDNEADGDLVGQEGNQEAPRNREDALSNKSGMESAKETVDAASDDQTTSDRTDLGASTEGFDREALKVSALQRLHESARPPIQWNIEAHSRADKALKGAASAFDYAVKIHELDPRFGRIQSIVARTYTALQMEPANPGIFRILGQLELAHGRPQRARPYLVNGAELGADPICWALLIQASAQMMDEESAIYAGMRLLRVTGIRGFHELWEPWVDLLRATDNLGQLAGILESKALPPNDRETIAQSVSGAAPATPVTRPRGLRAQPIRRLATTGRGSPAQNASSHATEQSVKGSLPSRGRQDHNKDPNRRAHEIEHGGGNLEEAKRLYREAIKEGVKVEGSLKDLAWLVRRTEGPAAALHVVEVEHPGVLKSGDATDNIFIDFLYGAGRYPEALKIISRQLARTTISYSRRLVLAHLQATIKLRLGEDSVAVWQHIAETTNEAFAWRGLALAYLVRGTPADLSLAEKAIVADEDPRAADIRKRIELARHGQSEPSADLDFDALLERTTPSLTPPLIEYVTNNYSNQATNLIEQRLRERRTVHPLDAARLAENAENLRGRQRENSADGYISAAVIVRDKLDRKGHDERANDEFRTYLCQGLVALADVMLDREHPDAARDLYAAALSVAESLQEAEAVLDVKFAFARYFLSLDGRRALGKARGDLAEVSLDDTLLRNLKGTWETHGSKVFELVLHLFAVSSFAGSQVLDAISQDPVLNAEAVQFLSKRGGTDTALTAAAWTLSAREWWAGERTVVREFLSLQPGELNEEALQSGLAILAGLERRAPAWAAPHIGSLEVAYRELRRSLYEKTFEERETCFRRTLERAESVLEEIQLAPTQLAVEALVPVCDRLRTVAQTAMGDLYTDYPPSPSITRALETIGMDARGRSVLQVKIANGLGSAPLESPELHIGQDADVYMPTVPLVTLSSAVRGGEHHIQMILLDVTVQGRQEGAFSVPLTLKYRARGSSELRSYEATLPVQLGLEGEFTEIDNPYHEGSLGRPVGRAEMFYGREDILERIAKRLAAADRGGTGFAIYGQKRAGKSSIRLHLATRLGQIPNLVVVDMGNVGTLAPAGDDRTGQVLSSLAWQIVKRTNKTLSALGQEPIGRDQKLRTLLTKSPTPIVECLDLFDDYLSGHVAERPPRFVLLFDEFQYFELWIKTGVLDPSFMQSLKAMIERGVFDIVIVGQDALDRLISAHANVFGVFGRERVTYLSEPSARLLIDEPIRIGGKDGASRYREGALDRIFDLTGGSPFYIQKFCFELVQHMNAHRAPFVTEADVEMVTSSFIAALDQNDFNNLETSGYLEEEEGYTGPSAIGRDYYRDALYALAVASREAPAALDRIRVYYKGTNDLELVLNDLLERDVVRKEAGRYRIVVRLYRDWLLFHHFGTAYFSEDREVQ